MRNNGQVALAIALIVLGAIFLIANITNINAWALCWPIGLILVGALLIARPMMVSPGTGVDIRVLGEIKRQGMWQVSREELWTLIGEVELDFSNATLPVGETHIRVIGLVGDLKITVPDSVGLAISASSFITDSRIRGEKREGFFTPVEWTTPAYAAAESKVVVESMRLVGSLKVR